jgi:hypothetical protein
MDGGCVTDNTLELDALNTTDFAPLLNGIHQGCKVSWSDANTLSVSKCIATINGENLRTTIATTVTWGCTSCSAEVVSTQYYLYAKTGSTGTTLNLLISTTAPNEDGYDNSGNRILGKFYNNYLSNIDAYSIDQWSVNDFLPKSLGLTAYTPDFVSFGTTTNKEFFFGRKNDTLTIRGKFVCGTPVGTLGIMYLPTGLLINSAKIPASYSVAGYHTRSAASSEFGTTLINGATNNVMFGLQAGATAGLDPQVSSTLCGAGQAISVYADIPIIGW